MRAKIARLAKKPKTADLRDVIVDAILDKKGEGVVSLDLREINESVTDFFIICHADSRTQVKAIADNVIRKGKELLKQIPWNAEGFENYEWVLIDYVDVVVHIFYKEKRAFYQLEDLWSDAVRTEHE